MKFIPFPKITNKRNYADQWQKEHGDGRWVVTVKLHGTNAAIGWDGDTIWTQSRNRLITPEDDNMGFAALVHKDRDFILTCLWLHGPRGIIYGEWAGPGVQAKVALKDLPYRVFETFAMQLDGEWVPYENERLFPLGCEHQADPEYLQEVVERIDQRCDFALKNFGIMGIGEGVVVRPRLCGDPNYWFKVKGGSHKGDKKEIKAPKPRPDISEEMVKTVVDAATERLDQAAEYLREMGIPEGRQGTKEAIQWLVKDIETELDIEVPKPLHGTIAKLWLANNE